MPPLNAKKVGILVGVTATAGVCFATQVWLPYFSQAGRDRQRGVAEGTVSVPQMSAGSVRKNMNARAER